MAFAIGMLRSLPVASAPSATIQAAPLCAPASRSSSESATPGPLAAARQAVREPGFVRRGRAPLRTGVASALQEKDARRRGQSPELVDREHQGTIDHPVDQQAVLARIDVGNAATTDFVVECRRRDDSHRFFQGREISAPLVRHERRPLLFQGFLEAGAFSVGHHRAPHNLRGIIGSRRGLAVSGNGAPTRGERGAEGKTTLQEPPARRLRGTGRLGSASRALHRYLLLSANER